VIYSALAGTLNIAIIIVPMVLGLLISILGYSTVFLISAIITLSAFPVLRSLICPVDEVNKL
jgi:MFS family permease